ncbi:MAG: hypothetical protein RIQ60_3585 [Pseudomonadota bacterium]|jgi:hypothetical protein
MSAPTFADLAGDKTPDDVVSDAARAAQLLLMLLKFEPGRLHGVPPHEVFAAHASLDAAAAALLQWMADSNKMQTGVPQ